MTPPTAAGRPRRWWLALVLNLLFPPTGYAYVGAWRLAVATVVVLLAGSVALTELTLAWPPAVYVFGADGLLVAAVSVAVLLGLHAAWIARMASPRTGPSKAILYVAPWTLLLVGNVLLRAYGPHPAYSMSSPSMQPTLAEGDVVMADAPRAACGEAEVRPGDVVVFKRGGVDHMHRVVAAPGETVQMREGLLHIDGRAVARNARGSVAVTGLRGARGTIVEETLPNGARYRTLDRGPDGELDDTAPTAVPAGSWYLMGDNRDDAADSRVHGPVRGTDICAVVLKVVYSKDKSRVGREP